MNFTNTHIVIDLEAIGFSDNSIVTSLAVTPFHFGVNSTFDELLDNTFYVKFDVKDQLAYGRTKDNTTMSWWKKQPRELQKYSLLPSDDDVSMEDGLRQLNIWLDKTEYNRNSYVFERGSGYDTNKLTSMYDMLIINNPINVWRMREIRTLNDVVGDAENGKWEPHDRPDNFIEHHAKHDAAYDAYRLIQLFSLY